MQSFEEQLVRDDARLLLLLTPPFDKTAHDPGYIKGYLPGVRENGAQYTHAALWAVLATALRGDGDRAFELFQMLNPLTHAPHAGGRRRPTKSSRTSSRPTCTRRAGHLGRGGWTWYTGSASWMYRVGAGGDSRLHQARRHAGARSRVPPGWPEFTIEYRYGQSLYVIVVRSPGALRSGPREITLDGKVIDGAAIPLVDDGARHTVVVRPK